MSQSKHQDRRESLIYMMVRSSWLETAPPLVFVLPVISTFTRATGQSLLDEIPPPLLTPEVRNDGGRQMMSIRGPGSIIS